jgi:hypothetical protein
VPHRLTDDQKTIMVNLSRELLQVFQTQQANWWHDIVSLDESWRYFSMDHERIWLTPGEPIPDREWHMIQSPKLMITIAWNPSGFHIVAVLLNGTKFNASYCATEIF